MKLTNVIMIWDLLHIKNTGDLGFCDLEKAIDQVVGVKNNCRTLSEIEASFDTIFDNKDNS